jgi:hypothetical protein
MAEVAQHGQDHPIDTSLAIAGALEQINAPIAFKIPLQEVFATSLSLGVGSDESEVAEGEQCVGRGYPLGAVEAATPVAVWVLLRQQALSPALSRHFGAFGPVNRWRLLEHVAHHVPADGRVAFQ